jgi:hypothetical protein
MFINISLKALVFTCTFNNFFVCFFKCCVSCHKVVRAHVMIRCTTNIGVGSGHIWTITVGEQINEGRWANMIVSSYAPPAITNVTCEADMGLLETSGNNSVMIYGSNFGPSNQNNFISANYVNTKLQSLDMSLVSVVYTAVRCKVQVDCCFMYIYWVCIPCFTFDYIKRLHSGNIARERTVLDRTRVRI